MTVIPAPACCGMVELPSAPAERSRLNEQLISGTELDWEKLSPSSKHIALGLAITVGSALGELPPSREQCLAAFIAVNNVGLTAGARAWSKHAHRSGASGPSSQKSSQNTSPESWWGNPRGPVASINVDALTLFEKIIQDSSWRNLHWLPHAVLVYEVRVVEGYGMRWSQDCSTPRPDSRTDWVFRGFVEPMMENGHELRWRH